MVRAIYYFRTPVFSPGGRYIREGSKRLRQRQGIVKGVKMSGGNHLASLSQFEKAIEGKNARRGYPVKRDRGGEFTKTEANCKRPHHNLQYAITGTGNFEKGERKRGKV